MSKRISCSQGGQPRRQFVLCEPPYPGIGERLIISNLPGTWEVFAIEECEVILTIPRPKKAS
jgi:hypothetical protein